MARPDVRRILLEVAHAEPETNVAVLLSGGVDSTALMFALLEAGKTVTAYSFVLEGRMSTDYRLAWRNAKRFGVGFVPVLLPNDVERLKADLLELRDMGAVSKTDYECGWPMLHAYARVEQKVVWTGLGADGLFCLSKKGMMHYRDRIDDFRREGYENPRYAQAVVHAALAEKHRLRSERPFRVQAMRDAFDGVTWAECNRPRQKQPVLDAFPERFARAEYKPHTNLQLGDSGISEHFGALLATDWNTRKLKSVVGIYNDLNSGALPPS